MQTRKDKVFWINFVLVFGVVLAFWLVLAFSKNRDAPLLLLVTHSAFILAFK